MSGRTWPPRRITDKTQASLATLRAGGVRHLPLSVPRSDGFRLLDSDDADGPSGCRSDSFFRDVRHAGLERYAHRAGVRSCRAQSRDSGMASSRIFRSNSKRLSSWTGRPTSKRSGRYRFRSPRRASGQSEYSRSCSHGTNSCSRSCLPTKLSAPFPSESTGSSVS